MLPWALVLFTLAVVSSGLAWWGLGRRTYLAYAIMLGIVVVLVAVLVSLELS